jgi:tetratricopeptide (TPR) repeat protein
MADFDPVEAEATALRLQNEKKYAEAAELFRKILLHYPRWELGSTDFSLAYCLQKLGDFKGALKSYEKALSYDPHNEIFLGNYTSLKKRTDVA